MNRSVSLAALACALVVAAAGCQTGAAARRAGADIDPCAERLHDLSGRLLFYYSLHGALPAALEDLASADPTPLPPLVCPVSGKPYVYNREGLPVRGRPGRAVLYDAAPTHAGMRWAALVDPPIEGKPRTARVLLLPERPAFSTGK
jgi:hypothetical protein